jgi:hypothetical protein
MVRVPERQQPKARAHSYEIQGGKKDEKTCRKRQVLGGSESADKPEKLAAVTLLYQTQCNGKTGPVDNGRARLKGL